MPFSMIAAMGEGRVIGSDNALPWRLPNDMRRFRETTTGHTVVMGRKTYESIGRALPNRKNVILTRASSLFAPDCAVVNSLDAILALDNGQDEIMVIGGSEVYRQMLDFSARLYLTYIRARFCGDQYFPLFDPTHWAEIERQDFEVDSKNPYPHTFVTLIRANRGH